METLKQLQVQDLYDEDECIKLEIIKGQLIQELMTFVSIIFGYNKNDVEQHNYLFLGQSSKMSWFYNLFLY